MTRNRSERVALSLLQTKALGSFIAELGADDSVAIERGPGDWVLISTGSFDPSRRRRYRMYYNGDITEVSHDG